ncbi:hypothetical protein K488DRAFT_73296 [Vararia minispora EC-137]|uniref:Uncharacterized protein n=1 Tax=Vararia minispora EC-137 TaxID=1314806 RepID=A0ACB8QB53_9AGAM|nr:hypothetical protein K488DRAFT_73296 [Vararia minispora EC-137]
MSSSSSSSSNPSPHSPTNDSNRHKAAKKAKKAEIIRARKAWAEICVQHRPRKWINRRMLPSDTNKPPLLHFGIGVKTELLDAEGSLVCYAKENGLYEEIFDRNGSLERRSTTCCATLLAVRHLSHVFGFKLEIVVPYSLKYDIVIAVYNNWDIEDNRLPPRKEKEILNAIRQAVGDLEQVPLWYHDSLEKEGQWSFLPRSRPIRKPRRPSELSADIPAEED